MSWEFRQYQEDAVAACVEGFAGRARSSVMLESPVGSGKTYMALEAIHRLQERTGRTFKVNWVAPRRHLLRQVMEANRDLHRDNIRPVSLFERLPPEADFVVLDEAHHEATQSCVLLYEKMKSPLTLGLSATPLRTDRMKLSFQETVTTCSIDRLIREGYLSPFHSYLLPNYGPQIAAECFLDDPERWGKTLAFFSTVMECCHFQRVLAEHGYPCEVVTAESDKDRQLEMFVSGKVRVVANVSMLTEGFDQPDVRSIFARDASRLPTIQMCGRGLRLCGGKPFCNIVQSGNTNYLFERVTPAQRAFRLMNGKWLALQDGTKEIEETLKRSLELLELREQGRRERSRVRRPRAAAATAVRAGEIREMEEGPYYRRFGETYAALYRLYDLCNMLCWGGSLPPCAIAVNKQDKPTRTAACAISNKVMVNGRLYPQIRFNLWLCTKFDLAQFLAVLMHEMTHVWQYAHFRAGGHGKDFRDEMARIGIYEKEDKIHANTPAARVVQNVRGSGENDIVERLGVIFGSMFNEPKGGDAAFFRRVLETRERAPRPAFGSAFGGGRSI